MTYPWYSSYHKDISHTIQIDKNDSIIKLFAQTCQRYGGQYALTCMGASVTFDEVDRLSDDFASYLQNVLKLAKGDRLAIMVPNLIQFPVALLGAFKAGVICVNTNPLYTAREMAHQFSDSGAKALLIIDLFMDKLETIVNETDIKTVIVTSLGDHFPAWKKCLIQVALKIQSVLPTHSLTVTKYLDALAQGGRHQLKKAECDLQDIAILQYTGGTTGIAKGAILTHENLLANIYQIHQWAKPFLTPGKETVLTALPLYHIFALSVNFLAFFTLGNRMLLVPKPVPIKNTVKVFKKDKITVMTGVNTLYNALNNNPDFQKLAPTTIKVALAGGMALQKSVCDAFQKITGTKITEGYGLTEASPVTHCNPLDRPTPQGSCGIPLPSTIAKVVDEDGNECKQGDVGELVIKGPQVMKGYWHRDDETAKVLKDGWLKTGDMCRIDEKGYFYIVDRKKDMILVSGFNVYPNEIEEVLAAHPKVLEAAVIGEDDAESGEAVKAFIVASDKSLTENELREYCKVQLTGYKRPRSYEFRSELPKTNIGKILRKELRKK
jgi:long-chain acyl-CoA synthetase